MTGNLVLDMAILAWFVAQVAKIFVSFVVKGKFDFHLLVSSGGMPSSHSALVCATAGSISQIYGVESAYFALAVVLAAVVMYDACNVRRAAGEQAKLLNHIMSNWTEITPAVVGKELKELLGHTPMQVLMGAILGTVIGVFGTLYFV